MAGFAPPLNGITGAPGHRGRLSSTRMGRRRSNRAAKGHWTRERIVSALRDLDSAGVRIATHELKACGHAVLVYACYRQFGSFPAARRAARVRAPQPFEPSPIIFSTAEVLAQVRALGIAQRGVMPRRDEMHPELVRAIHHHFGAIEDVRQRLGLAAAGARWSRERVLAELRSWRAAGHSLRVGSLFAERADLGNAIYRHVGSYRQAIDAIGRKTPRRRRR